MFEAFVSKVKKAVKKLNPLSVSVVTAAVSCGASTPALAAEGDASVTSYLSTVAEVFTWLITQMAALITFILGNPFLSVGLALFMCGAVISFFIRVKNS